MGEYNGVIGGVSRIVANGFSPWWEGMANTVEVDRVDEHLSPRDAFKRSLDWSVEDRTLYIDVITEDGVTFVPVDTHKAVVQEGTDKVLGIHGKDYGKLQNEVLCEFGEALAIVSDDVNTISAGALFGDKVPWMLFQLGSEVRFAGYDERIRKYLAVSTSHDGSLALTARPTDVRIECMNTFAMHQADKAVVKLRHTSRVADRIAQAKNVIAEAAGHGEALDREIEALLSEAYSETLYKDVLVPTLNPKPSEDSTARTKGMWERRNDGLIAAYYRDDAANIRGTAWGAVMGVNSYELWSQTVRGSTRPEAQAKRALTGKFPLTQDARRYVGVNG